VREGPSFFPLFGTGTSPLLDEDTETVFSPPFFSFSHPTIPSKLFPDYSDFPKSPLSFLRAGRDVPIFF